jgi:hypothetical protein
MIILKIRTCMYFQNTNISVVFIYKIFLISTKYFLLVFVSSSANQNPKATAAENF